MFYILHVFKIFQDMSYYFAYNVYYDLYRNLYINRRHNNIEKEGVDEFIF